MKTLDSQHLQSAALKCQGKRGGSAGALGRSAGPAAHVGRKMLLQDRWRQNLRKKKAAKAEGCRRRAASCTLVLETGLA